MELNKINLQEISNGNIQLLDKYVKNGGDINVKIPVEDTIWTPILFFIASNSIDAVKSAIEFGADINSITAEGYTCCHIASRFGCIEIFQLLEAKGIDIYAVDFKGRTSLHFACAFGQLKMVEYLVTEYPQYLKINDKFGSSGIDYAVEYDFFSIVDFLSKFQNASNIEIKRKEMKEWLELIGCLQYLQILIENGYDIESIRDLGGPNEEDLDNMKITARMDRKKLSSLYKFPLKKEEIKEEESEENEEEGSESESSSNNSSSTDSSSDSSDSDSSTDSS